MNQSLLLERFVKIDLSDPESTLITTKVYKAFTPDNLKSNPDYQKNGYLTPDSKYIKDWSAYIQQVSIMVGRDPSVSVNLYMQFMQKISNVAGNPMDIKLFQTEILIPMINLKVMVDGEVAWKFDDTLKGKGYSLLSQAGEVLEYFIVDGEKVRFIELNHYTGKVLEINSIQALKDQIFIQSSSSISYPKPEIARKLKLATVISDVRLPSGLNSLENGTLVVNTEIACEPLLVLRDPSLHTKTPKDDLYAEAWTCFMNHLLDNEGSVHYMNQVIAYHAFHMNAIPVIVYLVGIGGTGNSIFAEFVECLCGASSTTRLTEKQFVGQYNKYLVNKAVVILSESSHTNRITQKKIKGLLKSLTGERAINVEGKLTKTESSVEMFALPILISNNPWYFEDAGERRLFSIIPRITLLDSEKIVAFEKKHKLRIVPFIKEGIENGAIPHYISSFLPEILPPIPKVKGLETSNPIITVKEIVEREDWPVLFGLFSKHNIVSFFAIMSSTARKDYLYKQPLTELAIAMHGKSLVGGLTMFTTAFSKDFLPDRHVTYTPQFDLEKYTGRARWHFIGLGKAYIEWEKNNFNNYFDSGVEVVIEDQNDDEVKDYRAKMDKVLARTDSPFS